MSMGAVKARKRVAGAGIKLGDLAGLDAIAEPVDAGELFTAAASGSTSLGLSDRDTGWDAGAAQKSLSDDQYGDAHFWRDATGDPKTLAAYKLPFASAEGGTLTAVWKGVTAAAGAVQGARGGVSIPEADVPAVKTRIEAYYAKARKQYDDPNITAPWESGDSAVGEAQALAYAELGHDVGEEFAVRVAAWTEALTPRETPVEAAAESLADDEKETSSPANTSKCADCAHPAGMHAGDDNTGTCSAQGCDCDGFATAKEKATVELTDTERNVMTILLADLQMKFAGEGTIPDEHQPGEVMPQRTAGPTPPESPIANDGLSWEAMIVPEGTLTDDGRAFAPDSLTWRDLPLTLGAMLDTPHADVVTESKASGHIDRIWRDGNVLRAEGRFDSGDFGQEIARMVSEGTLSGVSVDVAVDDYETGPRSNYFDAEGNWVEAPEDERGDEPSLIDILFGEYDADDPPILVIKQGKIGAVTVCPFPAFADAKIAIAKSVTADASNPAIVAACNVTQQAGWRVVRRGGPEPQAALTASAAGIAPLEPPIDWFSDPALDGPTGLTVTDDGRVFGHAAVWDTCHIGIPEVCTTAPRSETGYSYFLLKEVACEGGGRVACGTVTLDTGHADHKLGRMDATRHYDDTGTAVADVRVGEDEHGIWVAGAVRPDVDAETVRKLRGAVLSGDWRYADTVGNLELVALLAVNVPGFPVPRQPTSRVASGHVFSLVAAGMAPVTRPVDEFADRLAELVARARGGEAEAPVEPGTEPTMESLLARARGEAA